MKTSSPHRAKQHIEWSSVALFYAIALGGAAVIAGLIALVPVSARPLAMGIGAMVTMLMPAVAGVVVEWRRGQGFLAVANWKAFRARWKRGLGQVLLWSVLVMLLITLAMTAMTFVSGAVPGGGTVQADVDLSAFAPGAPSIPFWVFLAGTFVQAMIAGLTINGVLAFGEEYGWRGVLLELLRPLGFVRANLLVGVLWGLWHAPLIMLGHNYGPNWAVGIPLFVLFTTPFSFLLSWVRERTGTVAAAAIVHGAFNGLAGAFVLGLADANNLIAPPVGVLGAVAMGIAAGAICWLPARTN